MLTALLTAAVLSQATPPAPIDASPFRDKLQLLTDGKGHYLAVDPAEPYGERAFYGDGKKFARVPVFGGGKSGTEQWSASFWDPRVRTGSSSPGSFEMKDSGRLYTITCKDRVTNLTVVAEEEAKKLLAAATFTERLWTRLPERLLRDDVGTYYLVDRLRTKDASDRRDFRVFVGPRGNMKQMPLKDIVDDTEGLILATKNGNLRLIASAGKQENKWVKGEKSTNLVEVDLERFENARLVYTDLGPYAGQRLGTPCDDLM